MCMYVCVCVTIVCWLWLSGWLQDLSQVTQEELVSFLREQGAFCLKRALRDMGVSIERDKTFGGYC
jgi:hypothetical protein